MCIICYKPSGVALTRKLLKRMYDNNPDGWGIAYPDNSKRKICVEHGIAGFRKFWRAYREVPQEKPMVVHCRISTSGATDESNCHPFLIDKQHAFAHNGNLENKLDEKLEKASDSSVFVTKILQPLFNEPAFKKSNFWNTDAFEWLMQQSIGKGNKMVILDAKGNAKIYNKAMGESEENGLWFSNKTYKEDRKYIRGSKTETFVEQGVVKEKTTFQSGRVRTKYSTPIVPPEDYAVNQNTKRSTERGIDICEIY